MSTPTRRRNADDNLYLDEFDKTSSLYAERPARSLKPPPEIWELVHPVQQERFKPTQTFASRLANRSVMYAVVGVVLVLGTTALVWRFRIAQSVLSVFSEPEVKVKPATSTPTKLSEKSKPIQASSVTPVSQAPTQSESIATIEPLRTSVTPVVKRIARTPIRTAVANALGNVSATKPTPTGPVGEKVSSDQNAASSEKTVSTTNQTTTPQPIKPKQNSAANSEAIAPVKTNAPTKPKVIQWP